MYSKYFFCLFAFSAFIQQAWSVTCERWKVIYDVKKGITGKYIDFSKIKLFRQRDTMDVSKNNGKEKIGKVFLYEIWILNILI